MATKKKKSTSSEKQLKATVKKLEVKLERSDAKATKWKQKAKRHEATVASSKQRVTKLDKKLTEARRAAAQPIATRDAEVSPPAEVIAPETAISTDQSPSMPDASWTVAQLREEARSRGMTGLSGKPKAEIIAALS